MPAGIYLHVQKRHRKHASATNPNWSGGPAYAIPFELQVRTGPTQFEQLVSNLGVPEQYWPSDRRITEWVHAHRNHRYVPEWLLEALGEKVLFDGWEA